MTRHLLVVSSDPIAGSEEDYQRWYDEVHLPAVLAVPGFVRAQRFAAAPSIHGELPDRRFLAIYELETDDLKRALARLAEAAPGMVISAALDRSTATHFAYTAVGPALEAR